MALFVGGFQNATISGANAIVVFGGGCFKVHAPFVAVFFALIVYIHVVCVGFIDTGMVEGDLLGFIGCDFTACLRCGALCARIDCAFLLAGKNGTALCIYFVLIKGARSIFPFDSKLHVIIFSSVITFHVAV